MFLQKDGHIISITEKSECLHSLTETRILWHSNILRSLSLKIISVKLHLHIWAILALNMQEIPLDKKEHSLCISLSECWTHDSLRVWKYKKRFYLQRCFHDRLSAFLEPRRTLVIFQQFYIPFCVHYFKEKRKIQKRWKSG